MKGRVRSSDKILLGRCFSRCGVASQPTLFSPTRALCARGARAHAHAHITHASHRKPPLHTHAPSKERKMDPPRSVTVAVVGDAGVGKTCLITAAAAEAFADHPPPTLPPTRLPADATPEGVPLLLVDTSAREEDRPAREAALRAADVVVVAFDACEFVFAEGRVCVCA